MSVLIWMSSELATLGMGILITSCWYLPHGLSPEAVLIVTLIQTGVAHVVLVGLGNTLFFDAGNKLGRQILVHHVLAHPRVIRGDERVADV